MSTKKKHILIAGTYSPTDAYPNVRYKVEWIKALEDVIVDEINFPINTRLNYSKKGAARYLELIKLAASVLSRGLFVTRHIVRNRTADALYIPYPATLLLWLLGWVPRNFRPRRIVADIFISLYETAVLDRGLLKQDSVPARLLRRIEQSAYRNADLLITDTPENSRYWAELFDITPICFQDLPLAINEALFFPVGNMAPRHGKKFRVLFVGTLVPLQGVEHLCEAIIALPSTLPMEFILVGDGQQASLIESLLAHWKPTDPKGVEIHWHREWMNSANLAGLIRSADLCIGILGHEGKTGRVWPLKNYLYMACGKPLVTANGLVSKRLSEKNDLLPFMTVDCSTPTALVQLLEEAPTRQQELLSMGRAARFFYEHNLSSQVTRHALAQLLIGDGKNFKQQ